MKTALITYKKELSEKALYDYKRKLCYDKYFVLTNKCKVDKEKLKEFKAIKVMETTQQGIPARIDSIFQDHRKEYSIFPYFVGDANTKYAIKTYNKAYGLKIDPKHFRLKSKMNEFLGEEVVRKKSLKLSFTELQKLSYDQAGEKLGKTFILKPVNAASSLLNFKISSEASFKNGKAKLKKKYQYVLEEYLDGNLYSLDLFCDGQNIFLLCFVREIPFLELLENFSPEYLKKYKKHIAAEFLHFLPIRYSLDLKKISPLELDFIKRIGDKLVAKKYHGFIHFEYKVKRKAGKIGFIEWGARTGGKRANFIEGMHGLRVENLPKEILFKKDFSRFEKKKGLYFLKNRDIDKNYLMVYTNVIEKTHIMKVLSFIPQFLNTSFESFLKNYLWDNWKIKANKIEFFLSTSSEGCLYPFYERSDSKFNYIMEFEEDSFKRFLKKKHSILEHLVFHDYKK